MKFYLDRDVAKRNFIVRTTWLLFVLCLYVSLFYLLKLDAWLCTVGAVAVVIPIYLMLRELNYIENSYVELSSKRIKVSLGSTVQIIDYDGFSNAKVIGWKFLGYRFTQLVGQKRSVFLPIVKDNDSFVSSINIRLKNGL